MDVFKVLHSDTLQLYIASKPDVNKQLDKEIYSLTTLGEKIIMCSLLTKSEVQEFQLEKQDEICSNHHIKFVSLEIIDQSIPGYKDFVELISQLVKLNNNANAIVIHCNHGVGRSGMVAAAVLMHFGYTLEQACELLTKIRGYTVPQSSSQLKLLAYYFKNIEHGLLGKTGENWLF